MPQPFDFLRLRQCQHCETSYAASVQNQRYCSLRCAEAAARRRRRLKDTERRLGAPTTDVRVATFAQALHDRPIDFDTVVETPIDEDAILRKILGR